MSRPNESRETGSPAQTPVVGVPVEVWFKPLAAALLLAGVTLAVFWPVLSHDFINYDDPEYVTENQVVLRGFTVAGVRWALVTGHASNWHPLTWLSHLLDVQVYGLRPWGHHLTSVLLHAANAGLLFLLLNRMTGTLWRSALVAALFALHPLHVESVAWISERKDVLSACFGFLSLIFYARYAQAHTQPASRIPHRATRISYLASLLFFALGLLSKPMLVTWPFVMLLLDWWPLQRFTTSNFQFPISDFRFPILRLVWEKIPFFVLSAASGVVTFLVQKTGGSVRGRPFFPQLGGWRTRWFPMPGIWAKRFGPPTSRFFIRIRCTGLWGM